MDNKLVVLVLGVGGNVSQGILKALEISRLPCRVVGACMSLLRPMTWYKKDMASAHCIILGANRGY